MHNMHVAVHRASHLRSIGLDCIAGMREGEAAREPCAYLTEVCINM